MLDCEHEVLWNPMDFRIQGLNLMQVCKHVCVSNTWHSHKQIASSCSPESINAWLVSYSTSPHLHCPVNWMLLASLAKTWQTATATYRKSELFKGLLHHTLCSFHIGHIDGGSLEKKAEKTEEANKKGWSLVAVSFSLKVWGKSHVPVYWLSLLNVHG